MGQNLKETPKAEMAGEHDARTLHIEARDHCDSVGDHVGKELIADEEGHIDFLETQLSLHDTIGAQNNGMLNAKPAPDAETHAE